jgi:uncharacterized tellurite resistance protein B-like protein
MLESLKEFLKSLAGDKPEPQVDDVGVAAIALALNVINADGIVHEKENEALESAMRAHYGLSKVDFDIMLATARKQEETAIDLFRFTSRLNRALDERQKTEFIGMLWQIVHADGERNELEDHLVWRIAELIGVSGRDRITKRKEAEDRQSE